MLPIRLDRTSMFSGFFMTSDRKKPKNQHNTKDSSRKQNKSKCLYSKIMNDEMTYSFSKANLTFYSGLDGYMSFSILASIRSLRSSNQREKNQGKSLSV